MTAGFAGAVRAIAFLDRYPEVDVVFGEARVGNPEDGYESWVEIAGQDAFWKLPAKEPEPGFRIFERRPFFRRMVVRNPVFIGACIMRRQVFEEAGYFDPELCGAADWELWLRMAWLHLWVHERTTGCLDCNIVLTCLETTTP